MRNATDALKVADNILTNIVPITGQVVNKVRKSIGSWGYETMLSTPIESYCLTEMGEWQLYKQMYLSRMEREITLDMIGDSTSGISNKVSDEIYKYYHTYNDGNNYIEDYQKEAGRVTTRLNNVSDAKTYKNNYGKLTNLYPDDDGVGNDLFTEDQKWEYFVPNNNKNSILAKTKQLFNERKINTIISRFHTKSINMDGTEASTDYGMSHGRNLLTYEAENNNVCYLKNGYDNPYCRVWIHHHQYSKLRARLMRPFTIEDEEDNVVQKTNQDLHKWASFKSKKTEEWGWKNKGADDWAKSVFNKDTGLINIAPKFLGGAEKNVHTKDCMFSIENLAWQGYDPYSFEKALSWEQRGPFGGRIMWFPPYGLSFSEDSNVNWNEHSFIGRGENVFTYANTSRSGTLQFMMVVDHPSILDYSTWYGNGIAGEDGLPKDTDIYRFFAGCDNGGSDDGKGGGSLISYVKPTPLTDEYLGGDNSEAVDVTENEKPEPPSPIKKEEQETPPVDEEIEIVFYVFFPNNYSGYYDNMPDSKVNPIAYLLCGNGTQWNCRNDDVTQAEVLPIDFNGISQSQFLGKGYEMNGSRSNVTEQNNTKNYIIGTSPNWSGYKASKYIQYNNKKWYYRTDGQYKIAKGEEQYRNTFDQTLTTSASYQDTRSLGLNYNVAAVKRQFPSEQDNENLYSLAEIAYVLLNNYEGEGETQDQLTIKERTNGINKTDERIERLINLLDTRESSIYKVVELSGIGYSNSHGNNVGQKQDKKESNGNNVDQKQNKKESIGAQRNNFLAEQRCITVLKWFKENYAKGNKTIASDSNKSKPSVEVSTKDLQNESGDTAKKWRSARITIKIKKSAVVEPKEMKQEIEIEQPTQEKVYKRFSDFDEREINNGIQLYVNLNETDPERKERRWYYDEKTKQMKTWNPEVQKTLRNAHNWSSDYDGYTQVNTEGDYNSLRYDQEYHFFKKLEAKHPDVFETLVQKLQYFDPAFHSMTPEGFMGRLNFLQQCTRQGNTISASDENGHSANNLAFGRPPFCILRLGDFYYQKIVIRNINITYDPLVLDLNNEGIGVVPLIANVTISFNFIGGGDLSGPVRRLQNAMSFNYYANGRLYDNRADRVERELEKGKNWDTMGAMGHDKVDFDSSYFHKVQMAK